MSSGSSLARPLSQSAIDASSPLSLEAAGKRGLVRSEMKPIRTLMAAGFDLEREILVVLARVPHLQTKLRSFRAGWIRTELEELRVHAAEATAAAPAGPRRTAFVAIGTAQWRAWADHTGVADYPLVERKGKRGWWFESEWPPDVDPERYQAA